MVSVYKVLDYARQVKLLSHLQSFGYVAYHDLCRLYARHLVERVGAHLVFGEEGRVLHLSDVVIHGSCSHELSLSSDLVGYLGGKVAHHDRVLECARSHLAELAQQVLAGV